MYKAGFLEPKSMSKRQRQAYLTKHGRIPPYLRKEINQNDTEAKKTYNIMESGMISGKIVFSTNALIELREQILRERYASPANKPK